MRVSSIFKKKFQKVIHKFSTELFTNCSQTGRRASDSRTKAAKSPESRRRPSNLIFRYSANTYNQGSDKIHANPHWAHQKNRAIFSTTMIKFLHTRIRVSDLDATIAFYEKLGFSLTRRTDKSPAGNQLAFLELDLRFR